MENTNIRPLTLQEQYDYYFALCGAASQTAGSWSDYRWNIAQIRKELRADPDYKDLVAGKFRAPEKRAAAETQPDDKAALETILAGGPDV